MKIITLVKVSETKRQTDLYELFCHAAKGGMVEQLKDKHEVANWEKKISDEFDKFAQIFFDAGVKHERDSK